jgi:formate hydrogenlyase subunit 3/multisubunit Na+/H+ antiporter MnhD subunit
MFDLPVLGVTLLLLPMIAPLAIALLFIPPGAHRLAEASLPWAPVPALLIAIFAPLGARAELPWLLLGGSVEMDEIGRVFLLFTALVWLVSGFYARGHLARDPRRATFHVYHLAAMTGNLGLPLAADIPSFYALFAVMTFSAHGIIIHDRSTAALRAGTTYLTLAVIGEGLLLAGVLLTAGSMQTLLLADAPAAILDSAHTGLIVALLLGGFGVKAALLPLHLWLPLAHPVAPTPGSATLSGAMIKAGLLGWLRFFPLGEPDLAFWGTAAMVGGIAGAYYGALVGLTQRDPKTVLAYSSVSQMGLMIVIIGGGLTLSTSEVDAPSAATIYALHHGMAKTSLFLAVGVVASSLSRRARPFVIAGVALPVLILAGAPLTSGAVAKKALEQVVHASPGAALLGPMTSLASVLTLVLLLRFAWVLREHGKNASRPPSPWVFGSWLTSVVVAAGLVWSIPWIGVPHLARHTLTGSALWSSTWPILFGLGVAAAVHALGRRTMLRPPAVPPGDIIVLLERVRTKLRPLSRFLGGPR